MAPGTPLDPPQRTLPFLSAGIAQVAQVVENLDAAVRRYWTLFGVGPWDFYTYQKPLLSAATYRGKPADYSMAIALSWMGPMRIELIQVLRGPTIHEEHVRKHGYGVQHLGVLTENMELALEQARRAGIEMIMDGRGFGKDGDGWYAYLDTEDSLGVTIELVQRPKRRWPPEKVFPQPAARAAPENES
jgi:methylmalonyl-CoA/ethylmalonyl-CoA epimerase